MRIAIIALGGLAAAALAGCNTTNAAALDKTILTLSKAYAHCHHQVTYHATVGAMNPASGAEIQGSIDCPALNVDAAGKPLPATPPAP